MKRSQRPQSLSANSLAPWVGLALWLPGCAMSAIVDTDGAVALEDGGFEESQGSASDPDDEDPPRSNDRDDEDEPPPRETGDTKADASKPTMSADAGLARDAGASKDAGARADAGPTKTDAARPSTPRAPVINGKMCRAATDCTESCVPIGILSCCRDNGTCGCTWAPGAYCL
jgi:hypothetical protein